MAQEPALPSWRKFELILLLLSISISTILALNKELSEKLFVGTSGQLNKELQRLFGALAIFGGNMLKALHSNL